MNVGADTGAARQKELSGAAREPTDGSSGERSGIHSRAANGGSGGGGAAPPSLLLLDNYDSVTYNLYQYLGELGAHARVVRHDEITVDEALASGVQGIVISPGPGTPDEAGISLELIRRAAGRLPLLGVCLGHQALGQAFGGRVVRAPKLMHGKTSEIHHDGRTLFAGLPQPFTATRYHSLVVERDSVPDCFEISAWTDDGLVMGLRHREHALEGVQFHPESILTTVGHDLLRNFLVRLADSGATQAPETRSPRT